MVGVFKKLRRESGGGSWNVVSEWEFALKIKSKIEVMLWERESFKSRKGLKNIILRIKLQLKNSSVFSLKKYIIQLQQNTYMH